MAVKYSLTIKGECCIITDYKKLVREPFYVPSLSPGRIFFLMDLEAEAGFSAGRNDLRIRRVVLHKKGPVVVGSGHNKILKMLIQTGAS